MEKIMIYLDNGATTKPSPEAIHALTQAMQEHFANPSSMHQAGLDSHALLANAKATMLSLLGATGKGDIHFTSGGTESNNLAILGALGHKKQIITSKAEHPSVLRAIESQKSRGYTVDYVPLDQHGITTPEALAQLVSKDTALVAIMDTNNETGAVNNIQALGQVIKTNSNAHFHVDAVASFTKKPLDLTYVDTLAISSHKVHGPGATGALYVKKGVNIKPLFYGGSAHSKVRPTTENAATAHAFAVASKNAYANMEVNTQHVQALKNSLLELSIQNMQFNSLPNSLPYIVNLSILGIKGQVVVNALSTKQIYISTGAACNERTFNILQSLGHDKSIYESALRVSFSSYNNLDDVARLKEALVEVANTLRF